jgi:hypothetical protein
MATESIPPASHTTVIIQPTLPRQTKSPETPFRETLANGATILLSGVEATTAMVAGPVVAAAVARTGANAVSSIAGKNADLGGVPGGSAGAGSDFASVATLQRESQAFNLQLLGLQEEIQQENRRFTTVSNVIRARHDTAKAAISNIRS